MVDKKADENKEDGNKPENTTPEEVQQDTDDTPVVVQPDGGEGGVTPDLVDKQKVIFNPDLPACAVNSPVKQKFRYSIRCLYLSKIRPVVSSTKYTDTIITQKCKMIISGPALKDVKIRQMTPSPCAQLQQSLSSILTNITVTLSSARTLQKIQPSLTMILVK